MNISAVGGSGGAQPLEPKKQSVQIFKAERNPRILETSIKHKT